MVDFKKLRTSKTQPTITNPIEIFRRLPKPPGINDLYTSQAQVLEEWYERRSERDIVIKLHTGGGKTLVGLLIAQSVINETQEPVVYLSPTDQLVEQTLSKAQEYSIPAVPYEKGKEFSDDFLNSKAVLVCVYQALFNGISRFGAPGSNRAPMKVGAIILDDAHVSFSTMRDAFTLEVKNDGNGELFSALTNIFRKDFTDIGKLGTFDDIVSGIDFGVLEVPYWSWQNKSSQVVEYLRKKSDDFLFSWPFLRDSFEYCHVLISRNSLVITPIFPLVDFIPTYETCPRRIYMSATIGDDSEIVRTFDAEHESIAKPITSESLAGVSERMILAPELMQIPVDEVPRTLEVIADWSAKKQDSGTVILVPSSQAAKKWESVATFASSTKMVTECVKKLQDATSRGPFVFANRYDGIDLPGDTCRVLIVSGLPRGTSDYDLHRASTFSGGSILNSALAQRIEQGMGRGARGAGDYCVVLMTGKDLISWIGKTDNLKFLTSSTRAQLEMGKEISKNVSNKNDLAQTILSCVKRNKEWIEYHAETLAELVEPDNIDVDGLEQAAVERKSLRLWRDGYFEKAIVNVNKYCETNPELDPKSTAWLYQFAARIADFWGRKDMSQDFQQNAYSNNRALIRPLVVPPYLPIPKPGKQAEAIVSRIESFHVRRAFIAEFDEVVSHLVPEASANQFEQALKDLGSMIGFSAERPEKIDDIGPDVIWLLHDKLGLVIEAKSRKDSKNPLTKEQHGQLLVSMKWFQKEYPDFSCFGVSVHPNVTATRNAVAVDSKVLTYEKLNELISEAKALFIQLCESAVSQEELVLRCEQLLNESNLNPDSIVEHYLLPFELHEGQKGF